MSKLSHSQTLKPSNVPTSQPFHSINCNGRLVDLSVPKIMGILNLTPDSFSDGGKFNNEKSALQHTEKMLKDGAEIIDLGPQSTRPKAEFLESSEEIRRIGNIISLMKKRISGSIDFTGYFLFGNRTIWI